MTDEPVIDTPQKLGPVASGGVAVSDDGVLPVVEELDAPWRMLSQAMTPNRAAMTAATVMKITARLRRDPGPLAEVVRRRERRPLPDNPLLATMPASSSSPVPLGMPSDLGLCWKSALEPDVTAAEDAAADPRALAGTV